MTTDDWNEVWRLFQQARELPHGERHRVLNGLPAQIAEELQQMLEGDESESEELSAGNKYGRYTLVSRLGSGGMGEVYSARDGELGRMVAIKFVGARGRLLPAARERLIREAQAASALNHPNLVTVHEVLRFESGAALVTELVNGQSLRSFCGIARPISSVAAWGAQIARALAVAHAESIVHSDVKPENIMLRDDGYIKILDFGLAQTGAFTKDFHDFPLGTIGYMSPEQTRGETLTGASDVFSLGVVLVELATAKHPFLTSTRSATTINIAERAVDYPPPSLPGGKALSALVRGMLEKDSAKRPTMTEVAERLERIASIGSDGTRRKVIAIGAAAVIALAAAVWWPRSSSTPRLNAPVAITRYSGIEQHAAFSTDGSQIAFVWSGPDGSQDDLYIRGANAVDDTPVRLTNDPNQEVTPVWAPDGKWLAWCRQSLDGGDAQLWVASVNGATVGPPRMAATIASPGGFFGLAWTPDSAFLVARDKGPSSFPLARIKVADGTRSLLTDEPEVHEYLPILSPDRKRMLFLRYNLSRPQVCAIELSTQSKPICRVIPDGVSTATWALDSQSILFASNQALWFASLTQDPAAPAMKVLEGVFSYLTTDTAGHRYAFNRTITDANIWKLDLPTQHLSQLISSSEEDSEPQFSPDGSKVLFRSSRSGHFELYACNRDGSGLQQLTRLASHCGSARWSPDGKWIAYDSVQDFAGTAGRTKFDNIYVMPAAGGAGRRLTNDSDGCVVPNWSADSRSVYYTCGKNRIPWKAPIEGGPAVKLADHEMWGAMEGADGKWIWFEQPTTGKGVWRRSTTGGSPERIPGTESLTYRTWEVRGNALVFLRSSPKAGFVHLGIEKLPAATGQLVGPAPKRILLGPATMSVSPDGRTILYTSEDVTLGDIYVLTVDGQR